VLRPAERRSPKIKRERCPGRNHDLIPTGTIANKGFDIRDSKSKWVEQPSR